MTKERHIAIEELKKQLHIYNSIFNHFFTPHGDVIADDEKRQYCIDLMKRSCEEKHDYVAEYYNIDVEHMKKHYDVIYD